MDGRYGDKYNMSVTFHIRIYWVYTVFCDMDCGLYVGNMDFTMLNFIETWEGPTCKG